MTKQALYSLAARLAIEMASLKQPSGLLLSCATLAAGVGAADSTRKLMTIRVAHVNVARGYRGGERQTELLIRELDRRQVKQVLVARRGEWLSRRFDDLELDIRTVPGNFLSVAVACKGVDVVHVHEGRSIYGAYLRFLFSGTPYIATRRVDNPISNHWFAHQAYRRATCVAAVAPQVAQVVRRYDPRVMLRVIHSSSSGLTVDPVRARQIRGDLADCFIVGHVGALDNSQKGQEFIIAVARELETSHPELHFVLVGGGADEAMLKRAATGLSNLTFTGFVENVGDYLAAFDVFVLPSRREGIGSILLDAMEYRLPVIAARVGGVPDIVFDGHNGVLIDSERPDQLRDAIINLAAKPEVRATMGAAGHELAKQYTAAVMADKYAALYDFAVRATR